jgi:hypothetical protein
VSRHFDDLDAVLDRLGGLLPFRASGNADVLLAVDRVADRRRHDAAHDLRIMVAHGFRSLQI